MELLLAGMLSCADGKWILDGVYSADVDGETRSDLVLTIRESMPDDCAPGYYIPGVRVLPNEHT